METADKLGKIEVFIVVFDLIGLWGTIWIARRYPQLNIPFWFITEVVTVPFMEEVFWRGIVFMILQFVFTRLYTENTGNHLAVCLNGLSFGLIHGNNLLAGVPLAFVMVQVLHATVWGVVYGYPRSKRLVSIWQCFYMQQ